MDEEGTRLSKPNLDRDLGQKQEPDNSLRDVPTIFEKTKVLFE